MPTISQLHLIPDLISKRNFESNENLQLHLNSFSARVPIFSMIHHRSQSHIRTACTMWWPNAIDHAIDWFASILSELPVQESSWSCGMKLASVILSSMLATVHGYGYAKILDYPPLEWGKVSIIHSRMQSHCPRTCYSLDGKMTYPHHWNGKKFQSSTLACNLTVYVHVVASMIHPCIHSHNPPEWKYPRWATLTLDNFVSWKTISVVHSCNVPHC